MHPLLQCNFRRGPFATTTSPCSPLRRCCLLAMFVAAAVTPPAAATVDGTEFSVIDAPQTRQLYPLALGSASGNYWVAFSQERIDAWQVARPQSLRIARVTPEATTFAAWPGDLGSSWFPRPSGLAEGDDGTVYWFAALGTDTWVSRSSDGGGSFALSSGPHAFAVQAALAGAAGEITVFSFGYSCQAGGSTVEAQGLCVARSTDYGASFPDVTRVVPIPDLCCESAMGSGGRAVAGAFTEHRWTANGVVWDLSLIVSTDGGRTFSAPRSLAAGLTASPANLQVAVASGGSEIYVSWDSSAPSRGLWFTRSVDGGATFASPRSLLPEGEYFGLFAPLVVGGDGALHVAWSGYRLADSEPASGFLFSIDEGATFAVLPTPALTDKQAPVCPAGATLDTGVALICDVDDATLLQVGTVANEARTIAPLHALEADAYNLAGFRSAQLAAAGANFTLVWEDYRTGEPDVYLARSTDGGRSFGENIRVNTQSSRPYAQLHPTVVRDASGAALVAWEDYRAGKGNPDIYFARCPSGQGTCEAETRVDDTGALVAWQAQPEMTIADNGTILAVWHDYRNGNPDIYFARSRNGGVSFERNRRADSAGSAATEQKLPDVAVAADGTIHVAWLQRASGDVEMSDVSYTRSTDGGDSFAPARTVTAVESSDAGGGSLRHGPQVAVAADGAVYLAWLEWGAAITRSLDGGQSFEGEGTITLGGSGGGFSGAFMAGGLILDAEEGDAWPGDTYVSLRTRVYGSENWVAEAPFASWDVVDPALAVVGSGDFVVAGSCSSTSCVRHGRTPTIPVTSPATVPATSPGVLLSGLGLAGALAKRARWRR
ncbi:MAG: hypothetical protein HYV63_25970 [Candidatus Schekmanbacteria bacterium]|nr:hypothetical protein [Candidatus Schekmanbacteria bacterium]